ncbi:hypothetical protein DPEC_G00068370 [Dallia pectoralis]|uniref:Uncharacterized protein n=1 Tax=Dallia pectoralis TaxID=75939 RepID=A0ACC2H245_DALPE|nr:hypothetical protein DPEC_G00068370 [Dallia pectoralis]
MSVFGVGVCQSPRTLTALASRGPIAKVSLDHCDTKHSQNPESFSGWDLTRHIMKHLLSRHCHPPDLGLQQKTVRSKPHARITQWHRSSPSLEALCLSRISRLGYASAP